MNPMPVADQNVERLVSSAYNPELVDQAFAVELQEKLCAAARESARARVVTVLAQKDPSDKEAPGARVVRRRLGWAMGLAASLAACFLVYYATTRQGGTLDPARTIQIRGVIDSINNVRPISGEAGLSPRAKPQAAEVKPVQIGAVVVTGAGERKRITLVDGSVLFLNSNTEARYTGARNVVLNKGEVYIEVAPREAGSGETFVVQTPNRHVSALGTRFGVQADAKGAGVIVTQGKVKVSGLNAEVTAGQQIEPGAKSVSAAPRASHVLDWTRELMAAAESPLVPCSEHAGGALIALDPFGQQVTLTLRKYHVDVHIEDGFARTTIDQTYFNNNSWRMEGTFYFPLPPDASLSRLAMYVVDGDGCKIMEGGMAEREHAREVFETIMHQRRDPALLEWVDGSTFKMRVFPLEGRQEKRIILSYTQRLPGLYGATRYRFPGGHNMELVRDWSFRAVVKHAAELRVTSDSHPSMNIRPKAADMVLTASATAIKPNKDVTVEIYEHPSPLAPAGRGAEGDAAKQEDAYFSSFVHENQHYLMVRYRPELAQEPRRERRDWVILFESAGNRDPLLARAQIDVLKNLLENAEHDDSFLLYTANTRVHWFDKQPRPLNQKNIDEAIKYLEGAHLIGALDLAQAIEAARPHLARSKNPWLVHLGAGVPAMGERADDKLAKLLPEKMRYVGIGIGKRWNRGFMKQAADRTGGFFTQINPDEPIGWRTFDLLSTLNTPRLMDVRVIDAAEKAAFLSETTSLAQGEELVAYTRVQGPPPEKIELTGLVNGKTWSKSLDVKGVVPGAGYLPRTWAKAEIDRLLADGAEKNKKAITDLSMAMYVMSPFTSLLVLETEQDYVTYKVDRGRKDHWALYDCPPRIPLVHEPDPMQQVNNAWWMNPKDANKAKKTSQEVLDSILIRTQPQVLRLPNQPHHNLPQFFTASQLWAQHLPIVHLGLMEQMDAMKELEELNRGLTVWFDRRTGKNTNENLLMALDQLAKVGDDKEGGKGFFDMLGGFGRGRGLEMGAGQGKGKPRKKAEGQLALNWEQYYRNHGYRINTGFGFVPMNGGEQRIQFAPVFVSPTMQWAVPNVNMGGMPQFNPPPFGMPMGEQPMQPMFKRLDALVVQQSKIRGAFKMPVLGKDSGLLNIGTGPATANKDKDKGEREAEAEGWLHSLAERLTNGGGYHNLIYQKPQLVNDQRLFSDLTMYAPGLHTSMADIQTALDSEAKAEKPLPPGVIDKAAKKLIDKARSLGWQSITLPDRGKGKGFTVTFAGDGRFTYDRVLSTGMRESVTCDGKSLWKLYPDIGLGSKRSFSAHHFGEIADFVPWLLPAAEDLARGADVKLADAQTVALVTRTAPAPKKSAASSKDDQAEPVYETHLVFASTGRLIERRIVQMPEKKVVARQTFDAKGRVKVLDKDGKVHAEVKLNLADAKAPRLEPDTSDLLVMSLPHRTIGYAFSQLSNWNGSFASLSREVAESLFIADCLQGQGWRGLQCFGERFASKDDRRLGFYVLLSASKIYVGDTKHTWNNTEVAFNIKKDHPKSALAEYLAYQQETLNKGVHGQIENLPGPKDGFVQRLAEVRNLWNVWVNDHPSRHGDQKLKEERARALKFLDGPTPPMFAWGILESVYRYHASDPEFYKKAGHLYKDLGEELGLVYSARYELARSLYQAHQDNQGARQFEQLYEDAFKAGSLPLIDADFRSALVRNVKEGERPFAQLIVKHHQQLMKDKRSHAALLLAWQMQQLGDAPLAEELFSATMAGAKGEDRSYVVLSAMEYLWQTGQLARADVLLQDLMKDKAIGERAAAWRLSFVLAQRRGLLARSVAALEKAMDLEYRSLPDVINLQTVRNDYAGLLNHYQQLATAITMLESDTPNTDSPPLYKGGIQGGVLAKIVRAADRWRALDPDNTQVYQLTAKILQTLGAKELAWDYLTTPIGMKPNEAAPWLSLAQTLQQDAEFALADRAFALAYEAEPTNAELLWYRAANLQTLGRLDEARDIYQQIAHRTWQPRFQWVQQQARWHLNR